MVPIRLKAEGFLTFRDPLEINFEALYEDGIFLISGPTGSGKTSLFDAISYALYGESPTSGRERARDLRSQLIADDAVMAVEYEFLARGRTYLVRRWQKGAGKVVNQRLVIDGEEENALTKVSDIRDAVADVLGLTADQFSKIVMLPQGEFQSFLIASSKDKSEILRKLFDTEHYARVRFLIKEKLDGILSRVRSAEAVLDQEKEISEAARGLIDPEEILARIESEHQEAAEEKERLDAALKTLRAELSLLELQQKQGEQLNAELKKKDELTRLVTEDLKEAERYQAMEQRAEQLNRIRPLSVSHRQLTGDRASKTRLEEKLAEYGRELGQAETKLAEASTDFSKNQERQETLAALAARIQRIEEILADLTRLQGLTEEEVRKARALEALRDKLMQAETMDSELQLLADKGQESSRLELSLTRRCQELKDLHRETEARLRALTEYQALEDRLTELKRNQTSLTGELEEDRGRQAAAEDALGELKNAFEKQGLAQFTHLVTDGEPCPLCGSSHHPTVYQLESAIDPAMIRAREAEVTAGQRRIIQREDRLENLSETEAETLDRLNAFQEAHGGEDLAYDPAALSKDLTDLSQEVLTKEQELKTCQAEGKAFQDRRNRLKTELTALEGIREKHDRTKEELTVIRSRIEDLKARNEDQAADFLKQEKAEAETTRASLKEAIGQADAAFRVFSEKVTRLRTARTKTLEDIRELESRIRRQEADFQASLTGLQLSTEEFLALEKDLPEEEALHKEARAFFLRLDEARTRLQVMEETLAGRTPWDLEALAEKIRELTAEIQEAAGRQEASIRRENSLQSALGRIRQAAKELTEHRSELETARKLDQTTGRGTTFENYVLGYYLDGVLLNANSRLRSMTAGRFSLVRQATDSGDRRAIEGLDINVFDTYSNTERDVKTLSGGESFKASLAMALGLSDFIQETKSGIRLETIFIDEGFGTLDQESLDTAMETILDIHGQGRLVGIISHVEELKERIPAQLIVQNNGAAGSTVKIAKQ